MVVVKNGCKYYEDCFTCPFADCVLGDLGRTKSLTRKRRIEQAINLRNKGLSYKETAIEMGVSDRTIQRYYSDYSN